MINFESYQPTQLVFGAGVKEQAGEWTARYGSHVLLLYGGGRIKKNGIYQAVRTSLESAGLQIEECSGVQPNPRVSLVREAVKQCRKAGVDFVLAVGGGSVIDTAKAIAAGVFYDGDVWDFYAGKAEATCALPIGVVLTIPAAGSESGGGSVISNEDIPDKQAYTSSLLFPKFALLDPTVCYSLPAKQIAAGGVDILSHVMERYFTPTEHTDVSDRLCEAVMKSVISAVPQLMKDPSQYDPWAEVMWAANLAHNGLLGRGREEDWSSHNIEHQVSAFYDITHGEGLAIITPAWMRYVCQEHPHRFVQYAVRVWGVDLPFEDTDSIIQEGIARTERFFTSLGLPTTLRAVGIDDRQFAAMAGQTCKNGPTGAFRVLQKEDVETILRMAL